MNEIFPNVVKKDGRIYTRSFDPGEKVYGEETVDINGVEHRHWDPDRSKLGAALKKGIDKLPLGKGSRVHEGYQGRSGKYQGRHEDFFQE